MRIRPAAAWGVLVATLVICGQPASAQKGVPPTTVIVGAHAMESDRDIVENLSQSNDNHVFMDLLQASGMLEALRQKGPFTVFAPTDEAFAALPEGFVETLHRQENRQKLVALLSAHIVPDIYSSARLRFALRVGKGQAELETLSGGKLVIGTNGPSNLVLRNATGISADITIYDVKQVNGVVFVIDRVVQPG